MKIIISNDHKGVELKDIIVNHLKGKNISILDIGSSDENKPVDYPDYIHPAMDVVSQKKADFGIIICSTGNGVQITANKHKKIRAALCWNIEITEMARKHNDANVLAIPANYIKKEECIKMIDIFLDTKFEGGRHLRRINKIDLL